MHKIWLYFITLWIVMFAANMLREVYNQNMQGAVVFMFLCTACICAFVLTYQER